MFKALGDLFCSILWLAIFAMWFIAPLTIMIVCSFFIGVYEGFKLAICHVNQIFVYLHLDNYLSCDALEEALEVMQNLNITRKSELYDRVKFTRHTEKWRK